MIFSGAEIVREFTALGISHVVWVPDSEIGKWEADLESSAIKLVRVCREGEAWPLAAGLILGGCSPIVLMQTTGLFESGDALRNVVYDLQLPVFALIGARNWLNTHSTDSVRTFSETMIEAWKLDYVLIESREQRQRLREHYLRCQERSQPGVVLLAE